MSPHLPPDPLGSPPPQPPGRRARGGCATVLLALAGIVLLLPGLCVVVVAVLLPSRELPSLSDLLTMLPFVAGFVALFVGGILMIRAAFRG
jgi:hypothetical protein